VLERLRLRFGYPSPLASVTPELLAQNTFERCNFIRNHINTQRHEISYVKNCITIHIMNSLKESDEKIIQQIQAGNIKLFTIIIERYENKLSRYIWQMVRSLDDREDILQNVFIKTYKNMQSFNTNLKFSSWIYRIAHNETLNWIKKYKNDNLLEIMDHDKDINSNEKTFYEKMEHSEGLKNIKSCINQIDIKYKEAILLRYMEEKSYEEISDILRKPISSIGTLIQRGIKELKKTCQNQK